MLHGLLVKASSLRSGALLLLPESLGSNSGHQAWIQAPLPTKPSHWALKSLSPGGFSPCNIQGRTGS